MLNDCLDTEMLLTGELFTCLLDLLAPQDTQTRYFLIFAEEVSDEYHYESKETADQKPNIIILYMANFIRQLKIYFAANCTRNSSVEPPLTTPNSTKSPTAL